MVKKEKKKMTEREKVNQYCKVAVMIVLTILAFVYTFFVDKTSLKSNPRMSWMTHDGTKLALLILGSLSTILGGVKLIPFKIGFNNDTGLKTVDKLTLEKQIAELKGNHVKAAKIESKIKILNFKLTENKPKITDPNSPLIKNSE